MIQPRNERRGNVCVLVVACLTVLLGVVAFAFDGGILMDDQQREQSTADASALAAACQLYKNWTTFGGLDNLTNDARTAAHERRSAHGRGFVNRGLQRLLPRRCGKVPTTAEDAVPGSRTVR